MIMNKDHEAIYLGAIDGANTTCAVLTSPRHLLPTENGTA